uniref:NADH-ubiquinone oxidoreductase chain 3 n=1 Tax=Petaloconchus erectus TaxID=766169 RepID=E2FLW3_9CAEN|nr:NADH dehydrogenase subunit 3 [Petaloconchus erectus]
MMVLVPGMTAFTLSVLVMFVGLTLSKKVVVDREKTSPFECGFDPMKSARLPFSLKFFLLAVIFLVFDVEVVLIFPMLLCFSFSFCSATFLGFVSFMLILILGVLYEWKEGSLSWMN